MSQLGLTNNIATATGILGCAWWAGVTASLSTVAIPAILQASAEPTHALKLWQSIFLNGAKAGPRIALITFLSFTYSAYDRSKRGVAWKPYATAAVLGIAMVPYTLTFMSSTNNALMAGAQGLRTLGWPEAKELLTRWQALNFVRSIFCLTGAGVGLWYTAFQ
ncbi:Noranthrone monooxygenase [Colletotrichum chlorophyti]|uniref:Noranthrone monooxygenase n=1 Tax=Colletotrichum chlorophyti TaxID=708187 RepID=A0A1Q8RBV4_9PEZI|nr:Noranthrone monooxygenase [Colletotrichum chlorophyti]